MHKYSIIMFYLFQSLELIFGVIDLIEELDEEEIEEIEQIRLPRTILRDRSDPMMYLTEEEFIKR